MQTTSNAKNAHNYCLWFILGFVLSSWFVVPGLFVVIVVVVVMFIFVIVVVISVVIVMVIFVIVTHGHCSGHAFLFILCCLCCCICQRLDQTPKDTQALKETANIKKHNEERK